MVQVSNNRRSALLDASIEVIAREGARGLTHRAVDDEAGVPQGTTSNYFRTREALCVALAQRVDERLRPSTADTDALTAGTRAGMEQLVTLVRAIVTRVLREPTLHQALLELRLEATRRPTLRAQLTATLQANLATDLAFHRGAKLPGGRREVVLLHLAIDGLLLDQLTVPDARELGDLDALVRQLVERLVPRSPRPRAPRRLRD